MRGFGEGAHVIFVALGGEIGIVFAAMQGIFGDARAETPACGVYDGHADAEGSKIDTGHNSQASLLRCY